MGDVGYHWRMGVHSGIPKCCVAWWCGVLHQMPKRYKERMSRRFSRTYPFHIPPRFSYIRCPLCRIRGQWLGTQHICDPEFCPPRSYFVRSR